MRRLPKGRLHMASASLPRPADGTGKDKLVAMLIDISADAAYGMSASGVFAGYSPRRRRRGPHILLCLTFRGRAVEEGGFL